MIGIWYKALLINIFYFLLLIFVYFNGYVAVIEICIFIFITMYMEVELLKLNFENKNLLRNYLETLDQYLRIGYAPLKAYEKMLEDNKIDDGKLKGFLGKTLNYCGEIDPQEFIMGDEFNYKIFKKRMNIIIKEIIFKDSIHELLKKSVFQFQIMKILPLIIEIILIDKTEQSIIVNSISLFLLLVANIISYFYIKEAHY